MHASSIEEFLKVDEIYESDEYKRLHAIFPHVVVVEGDWPEFDVALRWCWSHFGPMDGECASGYEYPACPLVLATEFLTLREVHGKQWEIKAYHYDNVAPHCHQGQWSMFWLGKTDYDHGFGEFCFESEAHSHAFLRQIPGFDWGEHYPWLWDWRWRQMHLGEGFQDSFGDYQSPAHERLWDHLKRTLPLKSKVTGKVIGQAPFGVFLDIGMGFPALLRVTDFKHGKVERYTMDMYPAVGSTIDASVIWFNENIRQIDLIQEESDRSDEPLSPITGTDAIS